MRLARRTSQEPETLLIDVVERPMPAEPGLENLFRDIYCRIHDEAMDHAEHFLDPEAAYDAVHEAIADIWNRWRELLPEQRTDAYFFGAIHNRVLKQLKREKRFVELDDAEHQLARMAIERIDASLGESAHENDPAQVVERIVNEMPPRRKAVFLLAREQEMTYKEVAETLGISVPSVATHMRLAHEELRAQLRRAGFIIAAPKPRKALPPETPEANND